MEMQVKITLDTTVYLPAWLKLKTFIVLTVDEDMKELELSFTACGNANVTTTSEKKSGSFLKS